MKGVYKMTSYKIKILLAEDEKIAYEPLKLKLEEEGYEVRVVESGDNVVNTVKEFMPNLLILDVVLPKKFGFEILKEMREDDRLKTMPVLILSNLSQIEDISKAAELGAIEYIIKSDISLSELTKKIAAIISRTPNN